MPDVAPPSRTTAYGSRTGDVTLPAGSWSAERLRTLPPNTVVKRVLVIGCRNT